MNPHPRHLLVGLALLAAATLQATPRADVVTYEQYGAVGDGVHDDQAAIVAAHQAANARHLPVRADDSKTYRIGGGSAVAIIQTDTDWGTAHFVIDDVATDDHRAAVFSVESTQQPVELTPPPSVAREQASLGITLPGRCLVHIENDRRRVYIRYGLNQNDGTAQQEVVVADRRGRVDRRSPITWDYDTLTRLTAYPIDRHTLTLRGGIFTTIANQAPSTYDYRQRGIIVRRSNVRVEHLTHYVTGEQDHGAPYAGFLTFNHCADVTVSHCLLTAHRTYSTIGAADKPVSMGSYDMQAAFCVGARFEHCRQTTDIDDSRYWGLFASNFCKALTMHDMVISRFDAHMGVANVTLRRCTFGYMGVQMVGFGTMTVDRCEIRRPTLMWLRDDYGSTWDGTIVIRRCTLRPPAGTTSVTLLSGSNSGTHDFGYPCCLPHEVIVDRLTIDDSALTDSRYTGPQVFGTFGRDATRSDLLPYPAPQRVVLRNVSVTSGKDLAISHNEALFTTTKVVRK